MCVEVQRQGVSARSGEDSSKFADVSPSFLTAFSFLSGYNYPFMFSGATCSLVGLEAV